MTRHIWSDEEKEYLFSIAQGKTQKEITSLLNDKFGLELLVSQVKGFINRNGVKTGLDGRYKKGCKSSLKGTKGVLKANKSSFKAGNRPAHTKAVGSERVRKGCVEVKVAEPSVWVRKHRLLWEEAYGPIPKGASIIFLDGDNTNFDINNLGMKWNKSAEVGAERKKNGYTIVKVEDSQNGWVYKHHLVWGKSHGEVSPDDAIVFLDGDKENVDIENLILITRKELFRMNKNGYITGDRDVVLAGLGIVRLTDKIKELSSR